MEEPISFVFSYVFILASCALGIAFAVYNFRLV